MPRVAKERRLQRKARLARQRAWKREFWGSDDWPEQYHRFLLTVQIKPGMPGDIRRLVMKARARQRQRDRERAEAGPLDIRVMDIETGEERPHADL